MSNDNDYEKKFEVPEEFRAKPGEKPSNRITTEEATFSSLGFDPRKRPDFDDDTPKMRK